MFEALHDLSHGLSPATAGLVAAVVAVAALVLLRRRPRTLLIALIAPAVVTLSLALDLDAMTETPGLMEAVRLSETGSRRFPVETRQSFAWRRRVCAGLQFVGGLPEGNGRIDADVRLVFDDPDGRTLATRELRAGEWRRVFSGSGDGGGLCLDAPRRFSIGVDVLRGDARFAERTVRLVLAVPRHHIVCPERLRGAAIFAAIPLLLGVGGAVLLRRRRRRSPRGAPEATAPEATTPEPEDSGPEDSGPEDSGPEDSGPA